MTKVLSKSHELEDVKLEVRTYFHCLSSKANTESHEPSALNKVAGSQDIKLKTAASSRPETPTSVSSSSGVKYQAATGQETTRSVGLQRENNFR